MLNYQRGKSRRQCFDWLGHWSKSKESLCHVPPLSHRLRGTLCSHQWNWWRWRGCTGRPEGWQKSLPYFAKGLRTYPQIFHNFGMFERFNLETPQLYPKYTKSIHLPPKILEFPMFSNIWLRHASLIRSGIPPSPRRSSGWCKPWSEREFRAASPTIRGSMSCWHPNAGRTTWRWTLGTLWGGGVDGDVWWAPDVDFCKAAGHVCLTANVANQMSLMSLSVVDHQNTKSLPKNESTVPWASFPRNGMDYCSWGTLVGFRVWQVTIFTGKLAILIGSIPIFGGRYSFFMVEPSFCWLNLHFLLGKTPLSRKVASATWAFGLQRIFLFWRQRRP